jgi:DNA invertase Pin-like site-specific DNA recombinase
MSRIDLGAKSKTHKLNAVRVKEIKRMLNDKKKNYTLRKIATKFRISDMQVYRIKSGANWSQVKV